MNSAFLDIAAAQLNSSKSITTRHIPVDAVAHNAARVLTSLIRDHVVLLAEALFRTLLPALPDTFNDTQRPAVLVVIVRSVQCLE